MANLGTGYINVVPKFPGLAQAIKGELAKADGTSSGAKAGQQYSKGFSGSASSGLIKSGAIVGAFSAITNKAMSSISANIGNAISRFDTLNNYTSVMKSLGYASDDADASLSKMDKHLQGLPTSLNEMVSTVQGLSTITGDLNKATEAGLAINDMLLASGSNQQLVTSAMEQFRQILAKGKPEMQDWRTLTMAMPGQLDQLAKSMLGPTANANDLYAALGGGKNDPIFTMDQLLDEIIKLDKEGGDGFASFETQARTASDGVQTSIARIETAITRGLANTLNAIGKENISSVLGNVKSLVDDAFKVFNSGVSAAMPMAMNLLSIVKQYAPQALAMVASFQGAKTISGIFARNAGEAGTFASGITSVIKANSKLDLTGTQRAARNVADGFGVMGRSAANALKSIATPANIATLAMTGIAAAVTIAITAYNDWKTKADNATKATQGLSDAISRTEALDSYAGKISNVGNVTKASAMSTDELNASIASHVEKMNQASQEAENQISQLNTAQQIIANYAGQTDLTAQAQGELTWALQQVNEQFGLNITAQDVANNAYTDADGAVHTLTDSINDLIAKKKEEIKLNALQDEYTQIIKDQAEAQKTYAAEYGKAWDENYKAALAAGNTTEQAAAQATEATNKMQLSSKNTLDSTNEAMKRCEEQMGLTAEAASESADAFTNLYNKMGSSTNLIEQHGLSVNEFIDDLRNLGANTDELANISEQDWLDIANTYDGSTQSLVAALQRHNISMDETAQNTAQRAQEIQDTLQNMKEGANGALDGIDLTTLSGRLADAGISTEQLNAIGSENISQLAQSCNGNIGLMVGAIQTYNSTPLIDKDGNVNVNDVQLVDAQGHLWTWNGSALVDQNGNAAITDTSVVDAQGHLWTWNGSNLQYKSANGQVFDLMSDGIRQRDEWNRDGLRNYQAEGRISIFRKITDFFTSGNAAGGIRPHADGGIIPRYHATGGHIATRAVPLDIVGEAGAEAIVPLTNRKYSQPFVDLIAEGINEKRDSKDLLAALLTLHNDLMAIFGIIPQGESKRDRERFIRRAIGQV